MAADGSVTLRSPFSAFICEVVDTARLFMLLYRTLTLGAQDRDNHVVSYSAGLPLSDRILCGGTKKA